MTQSDTSAQNLSPTERTTIRRGAKRARSERAELHALLDDALICHLGVQVEGAPRVLPTAFARCGEILYLHGSTGARSLREAVVGQEVCVTVTEVDGIVYGRATMHHSMNYRCAVIYGRPRLVDTAEERWAALRALTDHLSPGSWDYARRPNRKELAKTSVVALPLDEASVKSRSGAPGDDEEDIEADVAWAGVLPTRRVWDAPVTSPDLRSDIPIPDHVTTRGKTRP